MRERREAAGARRVVLKVVCLHVQIAEELRGDAVVGAFGKVAGTDEVACNRGGKEQGSVLYGTTAKKEFHAAKAGILVA